MQPRVVSLVYVEYVEEEHWRHLCLSFQVRTQDTPAIEVPQVNPDTPYPTRRLVCANHDQRIGECTRPCGDGAMPFPKLSRSEQKFDQGCRGVGVSRASQYSRGSHTHRVSVGAGVTGVPARTARRGARDGTGATQVT